MVGFIGLHQPARVKCDKGRNGAQVVSYSYPADLVVEGLLFYGKTVLLGSKWSSRASREDLLT